MPVQKVDRKTVIKASLQVFKNKGYQGASMNDIGAACGLLKGSIYYHFSSKKELMKAVIKYLHNYYKREIFEIAYDDSLGGMKKLHLLSKYSEEIFFAESGGCLMANIGLETVHVVPEFARMIKSFFEDWIECLHHIFKHKYANAPARQLAEQAVAEIEGAVLLMQLYQDKKFLKRTHERIINQFETGGNMVIPGKNGNSK